MPLVCPPTRANWTCTMQGEQGASGLLVQPTNRQSVVDVNMRCRHGRTNTYAAMSATRPTCMHVPVSAAVHLLPPHGCSNPSCCRMLSAQAPSVTSQAHVDLQCPRCSLCPHAATLAGCSAGGRRAACPARPAPPGDPAEAAQAGIPRQSWPLHGSCIGGGKCEACGGGRRWPAQGHPARMRC